MRLSCVFRFVCGACSGFGKLPTNITTTNTMASIHQYPPLPTHAQIHTHTQTPYDAKIRHVLCWQNNPSTWDMTFPILQRGPRLFVFIICKSTWLNKSLRIASVLWPQRSAVIVIVSVLLEYCVRKTMKSSPVSSRIFICHTHRRHIVSKREEGKKANEKKKPKNTRIERSATEGWV